MWNLFKAQLIAEYTPTTFNFADLNKVGKHGKYTESLYRRHFDITSGGLIIPRPDVPLTFEAVSIIYSNQNRFNLNANSKVLSSQLRFDHTYYWTARIIDSPTAVIITLFPGIWTDMFFSPNFGVGSRVWVNALSMSMYLQKNTVIGIRISKLPPYLVTAWSGTMFKTFDSGISAASAINSIMSVVRAEINLASAILFNGNPNALDFLISAYESIYSSIITPELITVANQIPAIYGDDFRGIDLKNNSGAVEAKVLSNITELCNSFLAKVVSSSQLSNVSGTIESKPSLTILTGVIGLDILKKNWIDKNRTKNTVVIDYNNIRFQVAKEYYETFEFYGNRIVRGNIPYENEFAENEFFQSEYSNYEYRYLLPRESRSRYRLFGGIISKCVDLIFDNLMAGNSVIFNARNIEKQDRTNILTQVKYKIQARIQTEFLEEFNLYADENRNSLNPSRWSNEQVEEYNKRLKDLKGVTFRNKVFFGEDLLTETEKLDLEFLDEQFIEKRIISDTDEFERFNVRSRYGEIIRERLLRDLLIYYEPKFLKEDETYYYSNRFLRNLINVQIQRFGTLFRKDATYTYAETEVGGIFMNEEYLLI